MAATSKKPPSSRKPESTGDREVPQPAGAPAGLSSWDGLADVPREQIRFGVVLNGGVSLAVWMGGGVLELDRLIKASADAASTPAYALLLRLAGASTRADVIAGTSAGGINGSALALAQVNALADVSLLRDIWIDQGQIETLLRQPFRGSPSSLMKGDEYFLPELNAALARLAAPASVRSRSDAPIDLTIATTVLNGNQLVTTDALGQRLPQSLHAAKFHWRRWPRKPAATRPGEPVDPFDAGHIRATAAQMALASRASASFPIAFEPTYVPVDAEAADRTLEDQLVRPDMGPVVEAWGEGQRDRSRFTVDGGLLANTPTQYALRAVEAMPASGPVRRVMLLVYPHAPEPGLDPPDRFADAPTMLETMTGLLGALSAQGGRTFVEELEVHNRSAAGRRGTRSDILDTLGDSDQTLEGLAQALFPHYRRLRKWRAARDLALRKVAQFAALPPGMGPPTAAWGYERVRIAAELAQDWLDDEAMRAQPATKGTPSSTRMGYGLPYVPGQLPTDADPDVGPGWGWGVTGASRVAEAAADLLRRLVWVLPPGEDFDQVSQARHAVSDLGARIEAARERTDHVWDNEETLIGLEPNQSYWAFRLGCYRSMMTGDDSAALSDLRQQIAANESVAAFRATQDREVADMRKDQVLQALADQLEHVTRNRGKAGSEVRALVQQVVEELGPALEVLRRTDMTTARDISDKRLGAWRGVFASGTEPLTPEQLLTRLQQLEVANSALGDEVETGSTMPVEVVQLSAQTENAFTRFTRSGDDKLGGMSISRFGGFLKRSWRLNDWIWGRLDAATILCRTVLHPARVRRAALLSGYLEQGAPPEDLAAATVSGLVGELFGSDGMAGDPRLESLAEEAARELTACFDTAGVAPGDLPTAMPALAHLFAVAVQLDLVPSDLPALVSSIAADGVDGANARSRGQFFVQENQQLIGRVVDALDAGQPVEPSDKRLLLTAFDRAGIGREPLRGEVSSDLMLRSGTTAAAVGATVLDSSKSGLGVLRPLTRGLRGAMLVIYWGMMALTGKGVIARSLALLGMAMGAILVTLAAFGAVPAGLAGLAAGVGISLLLLAFAFGALRSGTMLHGLVLLTPLVPVLAEAAARTRDGAADGSGRGALILGAVLLLALGLMALGTLPATTGSVWSGLSTLADRMGVPALNPRISGRRRTLHSAWRALRGMGALLGEIGFRLLLLAVPVALAFWVVGSGWDSVVEWLAAHFWLCVAVAVASAAIGAAAATHYGGSLAVLAEDRTGDRLRWQWRRLAHPAGVSASWSVVYGVAYLVLALLLIRDPLEWRHEPWAEALCATALLLGVLLTLVVPIAVPLRAFGLLRMAEVARAREVAPFVASVDDFAGHDLDAVSPELSYSSDLVQREVAYRRWVAYDPNRGVDLPRLTKTGRRVRKLVHPDQQGAP